jgi:hypothetical protein
VVTSGADRQPTPAEVAPTIWRWTAPHPEWRNQRVPWTWDVASFALAGGDRLVLVDALVPEDEASSGEVLARLDALAEGVGAVSIFITIPYHVRSSEELFERYERTHRVTLQGHPAAAKRLRRRDRLEDITANAPLPADAVAFRIGKPIRFETPVYLPRHRALAFGDAVVGVEGELRVWDALEDPRRARWYEERFLPTLRPLLEPDAERVLVTHGPPVLEEGRKHLERALAAPPWHYR